MRARGLAPCRRRVRVRDPAGQRRRPRGGSVGCCGSAGCARGAAAAEAVAALPTAGRSASGLGPQSSLSPPGPTATSTCPMSVSLVVIRLELAGHSPVPADFDFSAAGESAASRRAGGSAALAPPAPGLARFLRSTPPSLRESAAWGGVGRGCHALFPNWKTGQWLNDLPKVRYEWLETRVLTQPVPRI